MKKYFMFATVAIAALFASCSNSDDFVAPQVTSEDVDSGDALVPIQIGVGSHIDVSTRGTGTVGSVGAAGLQNAWYGQEINVFMTQKDDNNKTTMKLAENNDVSLYENAAMYTPGTPNNQTVWKTSEGDVYGSTPQQTGQAMLKDGSIKYYPINGNFDFFAYHGDGATATPVLNAAGDAYEATFTIDGTQDLMATKAVLTESQAGIMNALEGANKERYYSAYAARREVQPYLVFDHLLTRLQFNIKAGNPKTAGVETCYQLNADPKVVISTTTFDNMLTKADYVLHNYALIGGAPGSTISIATYEDKKKKKKASYSPQYTADGGVNVISADKYDALYADAAAKAAAYTSTINQVDPSDPYYTGVKVEKIEIYSKTKGTLLTAWTAADPQRLTWDAADATTTGWLSLQQHVGDTLGYIKNDRSAYIEKASWPGTLTEKEQTEYTPFYNPNSDLVTLQPVAPGYYAAGASEAEKFYYKQVGEALLVSKPVSYTDDFSDIERYYIRITLSQRVKTNWNGNIDTPPFDPVIHSIPAPEGGFKENTSYTVNLTLYGTEQIDVYTTVNPWADGGAPIPVEVE